MRIFTVVFFYFIRKTNLLFYSSHWESLFIYHSGTDFIQYT